MNCRELAELLIDYVAEELAPEQLALIQKHLEACPPCVTFVETYQITIRLTRRLPAAPMPPELVQRLEKALRELQEQKGS